MPDEQNSPTARMRPHPEPWDDPAPQTTPWWKSETIMYYEFCGVCGAVVLGLSWLLGLDGRDWQLILITVGVVTVCHLPHRNR